MELKRKALLEKKVRMLAKEGPLQTAIHDPVA
jgi:hypothetical protein